MMYKKKIVIYGGSFNPPHLGHASVIEAILRLFPCDEIWVMPSGERLDKTIKVSGDMRAAMTDLLIKELFPSPKIPIKISKAETEDDALTTTYATKLKLEKNYPDYEFYFFIGYDLLRDIESFWAKGKELYNSANFVSTKRDKVQSPKKLPKNLTVLNPRAAAYFDISSTFIRRLIHQRYSGLPYITKSVAEFIKENNLYK